MPKYLKSEPDWYVIPRSRLARTGISHSLIQLTTRPLTWVDTDRGVWFDVPVGFVCDWASVPNDGYALLQSNAIDLALAGGPHDFLYRTNAQVIDIPTATLRAVSKGEADEILRELVLFFGPKDVHGDPTHELREDADKIWLAVHELGGSSWHQKEVGWDPTPGIP